MGARLTAALLAGRAAAGLSRRLRLGGGTVIPGHVIPRLAPDALRQIARRLPRGSVVVSGTNGKTTTTRMIAHILRGAGLRPLHNRSGANLLTGLVAAVASDADLLGRPSADVGVFEVDEATVPAALGPLQPRVLALTNVFRDQLDRYGEVHYVAGRWRDALGALPADATLALNVDDPLVAALAADWSGRTLGYGIGDRSVGLAQLPHAMDARLCVRCSRPYRYETVFYGHLGHYACPAGDTARPAPAVEATAVRLADRAPTELRLRTPAGELPVCVALPGLYNVYNALAATAVCLALGVEPALIARGLETFAAAFGRLERVAVEGRALELALVKNPVGFDQVLRTVLAGGGERTLLIAINDRFADGTDVSWLWDVEFEQLAGRVSTAVCSGLRAEDLAVRLKYAGVEPARIKVENDLRLALELALEVSEPGETVYVLPTYTAMLDLRELLHRLGYVVGFWED